MARNFFNEIRSLKLKDLPDRILPMLSPNNLKAAVGRGLDNYHAKYIETSSVDPLFHVCFGGMALSYLVGVELISSVSPRKRVAVRAASAISFLFFLFCGSAVAVRINWQTLASIFPIVSMLSTLE
ncbi:hypothetical protein AKJ16_DCAP05014 [Drosera capensis]